MQAGDKLSSPTSDGLDESTPAVGSGRTRRSAAVASKHAWQALMPHKKGVGSGDEEDYAGAADETAADDDEYQTKPTPKERRKRVTPAAAQNNGTSSRKRSRITSKTPKAEMAETVDEEESPETNIVSTPKRKVLVPQQQEKLARQTVTGQGADASVTSSGNAVEKSPKRGDSPRKYKQPKSNANASVSAQQLNEQQQQKQAKGASATATITSTSQPLVIRPKASILAKRMAVIVPKVGGGGGGGDATAAAPNPMQRLLHQQLLSKTGGGALNKEQLEEIEREVEKHGLDDASVGKAQSGGYAENANDMVDEYPPPPPKPAVAARVNTIQTRIDSPRVGGAKRGPKPKESGKRAAKAGAGDLGELKTSAGSVVGPAIMMNSARQPIGPGGTVKVLRIRANAGMPNGGMASRGGFVMPSSSGGALPPPRPHGAPQLGAFSSMYANLTREVNDVAERYADRVVPGSTVREFNLIIDDITHELNRVLDDKTRAINSHREYMDQINLAHAAEIDMKDKKIQELELTVDTLQAKLMVAMKRIQLNALKNDTAKKLADDAGNAVKPPPTIGKPIGGDFSSKESIKASAGGGETTESGAGGAVNNDATNKEAKPKGAFSSSSIARPFASSPPQQQQQQQQPTQQQKVAPRPIALSGARVNAFRYYDAEEDAEGTEEDESGNDAALKTRHGAAVSGPGGGSIFKSAVVGGAERTRARVIPTMPLNTMNGQRVLMRNYPDAVRSFPQPMRRYDDSEDAFDDDEEDMLDEMEEEDEDLALTASERRQLANLASRGGLPSLKKFNKPSANREINEEDEDAEMTSGADEIAGSVEVGANKTVL